MECWQITLVCVSMVGALSAGLAIGNLYNDQPNVQGELDVYLLVFYISNSVIVPLSSLLYTIFPRSSTVIVLTCSVLSVAGHIGLINLYHTQANFKDPYESRFPTRSIFTQFLVFGTLTQTVVGVFPVFYVMLCQVQSRWKGAYVGCYWIAFQATTFFAAFAVSAFNQNRNNPIAYHTGSLIVLMILVSGTLLLVLRKRCCASSPPAARLSVNRTGSSPHSRHSTSVQSTHSRSVVIPARALDSEEEEEDDDLDTVEATGLRGKLRTWGSRLRGAPGVALAVHGLLSLGAGYVEAISDDEEFIVRISNRSIADVGQLVGLGRLVLLPMAMITLGAAVVGRRCFPYQKSLVHMWVLAVGLTMDAVVLLLFLVLPVTWTSVLLLGAFFAWGTLSCQMAVYTLFAVYMGVTTSSYKAWLFASGRVDPLLGLLPSVGAVASTLGRRWYTSVVSVYFRSKDFYTEQRVDTGWVKWGSMLTIATTVCSLALTLYFWTTMRLALPSAAAELAADEEEGSRVRSLVDNSVLDSSACHSLREESDAKDDTEHSHLVE